MRKSYLICMAVLSICLAGCEKESMQNEEKAVTEETAVTGQETVLPGNAEKPSGDEEEYSTIAQVTPLPEAVKNEAKDLIARYETWEYSGQENSFENSVMWENSNLNNIGYLCDAGNGMIYYRYSGDLYYGKADGSGRVLISEQDAGDLQVEEEKLYFRDEKECKIYCYDPAVGSVRQVMEQSAGNFAVIGNKLYYCGIDGIYCYTMDTGAVEQLVNTEEYVPIWMTMTDTTVIYVAAKENAPDFASNGLLFAYSLEDQKLGFAGENMWMPTLAGNEVISLDLGELVALDLTSGEKTEYGIGEARVSADSDYIYYPHANTLLCMSREDKKSRTVLELENDKDRINYCYQTEEKVYVYGSNGSIYYYDKANGKNGRFE